MAFTVSHIAAVLPAYRPLSRARVFSAAVIGSMVPDFGFLLPGDFARWQTHSVMALFTFCLPAGLLTYWLVQSLIKPAVLEALPNGPYARLMAQKPPGPWNSLRVWMSVVIALLFGACTHLLWDGFTHENARGVRLFPQLLQYGPEMAGHWLRLYMWLQYGTSVLGLAVLMAAVGIWLRHAREPHPPPARRLSAAERLGWMLAYAALPLAVWAWLTLRPVSLGEWPAPLNEQLDLTAIASLRATGLSLLLISALLRLRLAATASA